MQARQGKSGKYYLQNPFGIEDYVWAVYDKLETVGKQIPDYVSDLEAKKDFKDEVFGYKVTVGFEESQIDIYTNQVGIIVHPMTGDLWKYLEGSNYTKIKHQECIITNFVV